jgi:hypothetical protein
MASGKFQGLMQTTGPSGVGGVGEVVARLGGVVAQEVHRLAHLGHGVGEGLAGFAHQQAHQGLQFGFQQVGGAASRRPARLAGWLPDRPLVRARASACPPARRGFAHLPDDVAVVGRVAHGLAGRASVSQPSMGGLPGGVGAGEQGGGE